MYFKRATAYEALGETSKAIEDYEKAISLNSEKPYALNNLGILHHSLGNHYQSARYFAEAQSHIAGTSSYKEIAYVNEAYIHISTGEVQRAIDSFTRIIEIDKIYNSSRRSPRLLFDRAVIYARSGNFQSAINDLKEARELYSGATITRFENNSSSLSGMRGPYIPEAADQLESFIEELEQMQQGNIEVAPLLSAAVTRGLSRFVVFNAFRIGSVSYTGSPSILFNADSSRTFSGGGRVFWYGILSL